METVRVACLAGLLACGLLAGALGARAQAQAQPKGQARAGGGGERGERYEDVVREGIREYSAGNFVEARTLFERAHALKPSARTLRGLGLTSYELKHYVLALQELQAALDDARNPLTDAQRAEVVAAIAKTKRYVGTLVLAVDPEGASVLLDGQPAFERKLTLDAGDHALEASAPGYRDNQQRVTVIGGRTTTIAVHLPPLELSPADAARANGSARGSEAASSARDGRDSGSGGGLLSKWWFWTIAGVVVAGATVTTIVVLGNQQATAAPYKGSTDVALAPP
jgi:tetratricopeptide (TPR) repeat protein